MFPKMSVKKPYTVFVGVAVVIILGVISFMNMTTDLLPSMDLPYVVVYTTYPGASPEAVETTVTKPLESAFATVSGLADITSRSQENVSVVIMEFASDTNMDSVMLDLDAKIDTVAPAWDDAIGAPVMMKLNPDMLPVMVAAVDKEGMTTAQLSELVEDKIQPALEAVDGVGSVTVSGLIEEDITITLEQSLVDELNSRILREIDSELADVEQELIDAEKQLNSAEKQLNKKGKAGLKQIADSLEQVRQGKASIETALKQSREQLSTLESQKSQAEGGIKDIDAALPSLPESMTDEQSAALASMRENLSSWKSRLADKKRELDTLKEQPVETDPPVTETDPPVTETDPPVTETDPPAETAFSLLFPVARAEGNAERIAELEREIGELEAQISGTENSDEYKSLVALESAVQKRAELVSRRDTLSRSVLQLEDGISQLQSIIAKLEKGVIPGGMVTGIDDDLDTGAAEAQLTQAQSDAERALRQAGNKINDGQSQIKQAREEFDKKREEAFEKADLGGVITLQMLSQILAAQNFEMPAGYVYDDDSTEYLVRVGKKYEELDALRDMLLFELELDTVPEVRLGDVATVAITDNADKIYARLNKNNGILLSFNKQSTSSTAEVSKRLLKEFEALSARYDGLRLTPLMDQGVYIDLVVDSVLENLLYGGALAILILLLFLGDFRPTLIVALSIPFSVVFAFVAMYFTGITLNVMSLAGLALGVGMLVDNSIVVIENIYRLRGEGMPLYKACVVGAKQMSGAIFSSTLTTVCVFAPIVFVQGIARDIFTDMGLTIAYSLLASLVVALTVVPALSSFLLRKPRVKKERVFGVIRGSYTALLRFVLRHKAPALLLSIALLAWTGTQVAGMGTSFMPDVDSTQMTATMTVDSSMPFADMTSLADDVLDRVLSVDEVETVGVFTGTGTRILSGGGGGGTTVSYYISLRSDKTRRNTQISEAIKEAVSPLGVDLTVKTSNMDISMLSGSGISIGVRGNDLDTLRAAASDVADIMRGVDGLTDISDGQEETTPQLTLIVDKEAAVKNNLTVAQVYSFVATTIADGSKITTMKVSDKDYPVITVDAENQRITPAGLMELTIDVTDRDGEKAKVRLGDICSAEMSDSLATINRDSQQRIVTASAAVKDGFNTGLVSRALNTALEAYTPPDGCTLVVSGENETVSQIMNDLIMMILLAVALIYLIMVAQFQSLLLPFIVLFTIPLAFTGGLIGLLLTGMDISIVALLGFLVLSGVIVNNGIVFVDGVNQLRMQGMPKRDALVETGRTRLRPILMTALTTILGMFTMALGTGMGAEMMQPMAVVTIGGLSYATLMTLLVVPALYDIFTGKRAVRGAAKEEQA